MEHNKTQNQIARIVAARGVGAAITPGEEPPFDLAWFRGRAVWVAEVKSITSTNPKFPQAD